jgi:formylglycine-generating enzyme required for sulfatase activity
VRDPDPSLISPEPPSSVDRGDDVFGLLGTVINGKVRVDELVGEGGFAVVYRGFHLSFEQPVAVKCLKLPMALDETMSATFSQKLQAEGKMLFLLSQHTSIVRVLDIGELETRRARVPYLELEWLDGINLDVMMARRMGEGLRPWTESEVLSLLRPAVDAIALAHRMGIAHRDLKPSNLVLANTVQGEVLKVLDFGVAKVMQEGEAWAARTTHTSSGFHAFSPRHGAPEQFRARMFGATGPWTDVHALGLVMTELVAGRPAMIGNSFADYYDQSMSATRPTPRACGASVSDGFEALCSRCLAREPELRFQDASELLAAMDALEMGVHAWMSPRVSSMPPAPTSEPAPRLESLADLADTDVVTSPRIALSDPPVAYQLVADKPATTRWPFILAGVVGIAVSIGLAWGHWPAQQPAIAPASATPTEAVDSMTQVPAGTFRMGAEGRATDQRPEHEVSVGAFELDVTEVTVEAFSRCVSAGKCNPSGTVHLTGVPESDKETWNRFCNWGVPGREQHPMNCVDWHQAQAFCAWAGKRLPSEAEWEYAASGGDEERNHPWGDAPTSRVAFNGCGRECVEMARELGWTWELQCPPDPWPTTAPVGSFPASAGRWGHQDLTGNVWEWTATPYGAYGKTDPDPGKAMVARGGGWASRYSGIFLNTYRAKFPPEYRAQDVGIRCAR